VGEDGAVSAVGAAAARAVRAVPRRGVRGDEGGAGRVEGQGESYAEVEVWGYVDHKNVRQMHSFFVWVFFLISHLVSLSITVFQLILDLS